MPSTLSIVGGLPGGYSVQPSEPPTPRTFDVIWPTSLTVGVTQTFSLNVVPLAASTSRYHEQVATFVVQPATMPFRYAGASDAVWVRIGAVGTPGTVSPAWPNALPLLSAGYEALPDDGTSVVQLDGAGNSTPLPVVTAEELPEHEPLSSWLSFGTFVDASTPITAALTVHNTIGQAVSYTGTLTLPADWQVVSGAATWTETLAPGEQVVHPYLVLPAVISCTWKATVAMRVGAATCANGHGSVLLELEGGLYPCHGEADWLHLGEPAGSKQVYTGRATIVPRDEWGETCPPAGLPNPGCAWCLPGCGAPTSNLQQTMVVRGTIYAVHYPTDTYLARLRLRVLAGATSPQVGGKKQSVGQQLAIVRLDDTGSFWVCVPWRPSVFLEVTATDEIKCDPPWAAETVIPEAPENRYVAYSPIRSVNSPLCYVGLPVVDYSTQVIQDWVGDYVRAASFFPATLIAFEMQDFFSGHAGQTLRDTGALRLEHDYRASFVYPMTQAELGNLQPSCIDNTTPQAAACYRPPHIYLSNDAGANYATVGKVIEHEYGHRAHHAKGGWPGAEIGCNFCENVAEFIRVAKEEYLGSRGVDAPCYPWPYQLEPYRNPDPKPDCWTQRYYDWSPWLYDLFDVTIGGEPIDDGLYRCPNDGDPCDDIWEWSNLPFRNMWDVFAIPILDGSEPTPGKRWTELYVAANGLRRPTDPSYQCQENDWYNMKRVSVYHAVYECTDAFPEAPPTATPPP